MKKVIVMALAAAFICGCENPVSDELSELEEGTGSGVYRFSINMGGGFTTRGDMTADGTEMTDLWVFDYVGGECKQSVSLTPMSAEWGEPSMTLSVGEHTLYFVTSRGDGPNVNENEGTIIWETPKDAFAGELSLKVSGGGGTHSVTLHRVATKMKVSVLDLVPEGVATLSITPEKWYFGYNYITGEAISEQKKERTVEVPSAYIGTTRKLAASFFGISDDTEWVTDVAVKACSADGTLLGTASIKDAPFLRNRVSEFSGNLFNGQGSMDLTLDGEWGDAYTGGW
jgi:hypothetical protein